jgi:hypothetical protein
VLFFEAVPFFDTPAKSNGKPGAKHRATRRRQTATAG